MFIRRCAFTLVELLIVFALIGILAMIIIPKYSIASDETRESALIADLHTLTRQIALYRIEHNDQLPHCNESGANDTGNMLARLTSKTDSTGKIIATGDCGPYVLEWPPNPFAETAIAQQIKFGTAASSPRDGSTGWYYNTNTGKLSANTALGALDY